MSDSVGNVLKYSRGWSRKVLKSISCISLSNSGNWLSAAQHSSLLIFHADNGTLAVKVECPTAITAMLWAVVCCTADGTIMTISLLQWEHNTYLATGWGKDIRIWRRRTTDGTWEGLQKLTSPPTSHANASSDIAITSLHWLEPAAERTTALPSQLIVSYRRHGIQ
ncbi:hypothetical protein BC629DRAFT_1599576 [Irpex lacteus]|nr:hypothetical protein BC629DRAFT_1599576 [Irpex lacteus]